MMPLVPLPYLGNIDFFLILANHAEVQLEYCETFPKQTWRNRCRILSANGPLDLTVPVQHGASRLFSEIRIDDSVNWQHQHWNALLTSYNRSPFFEFYEPELKELFWSEHTYLAHFNRELLNWLALRLKLNTRFVQTTGFAPPSDAGQDFRQRFKPSKFPQLFLQSPYTQVFTEKFGFVPNLSILDLLFNEGPQSAQYLRMQGTVKII